MTRKKPTKVPDLLADPFGERRLPVARQRLQLLGGRFEFESNSPQLLSLVDSAYTGLPRHLLSAKVPQMKVRLLLTSGERPSRPSEPPPLAMLCGDGLLAGAPAASSFVVVSAGERSALVAVSQEMLRFPYHTRYELIEFAVFTLAARAQGLVPLHAACIGLDGRGVILMGPSGSGKSTVSLHCLLQGFDFLSEDSVFVVPDSMVATGVANYIHVRSDSLRWLARARDAAAIRRSPVIQRRSGVKKFEVDLRRGDYRLAASALKIVAVVFLSARKAARPLLVPLPKSGLPARLAGSQAYAANQPQWSAFCRGVAGIDVFELRRGRHPLEAVEAVRELLAPPSLKVTKRAQP